MLGREENRRPTGTETGGRAPEPEHDASGRDRDELTKEIREAGGPVRDSGAARSGDGRLYLPEMGGPQQCKAGDWLVSNDGDTYTVDQETFARTYRPTGPGTFVKTTPVWAEVASAAGEIPTKKGSTRYRAGDYVVFNQPDGTDGYAVSKSSFERMYEPAS
jgi:hypothetical protein